MIFENLLCVDGNMSDKEREFLARMAGIAFLEEPWTREMLDSMSWSDYDGAKERAVSIAVFAGQIDECIDRKAPCVYCTKDRQGLMVAYLSSELPLDTTWADIEEAGINKGLSKVLLHDELAEWEAKEDSVDEGGFVWNYPVVKHEQEGGDFIHILSFAVAPQARGTGTATELMTPFLLKADELGVPIYLECLSERLESLYIHYGFEVVEERHVEGIDIYERIMMYSPQTAC